MTTKTRSDLQGLRILNPRPRPQAAELSHLIHSAGGIAVELPLLEIQAVPSDWLSTLPILSSIQFCIFVSPNAVTYFFAGLGSANNWPTQIQVFAIGKGTATALNQHGIESVMTPTLADSEHLLQLPQLQKIQGQLGLLISGEKSRPLIEKTLINRGACLHHIAVYRRIMPKNNRSFIQGLWQDDAVDIILMLSKEAIENLFALFNTEARTWLQSKIWVVISPRLVNVAQQYQIKNVIYSAYDDLLNTLRRLARDCR